MCCVNRNCIATLIRFLFALFIAFCMGAESFAKGWVLKAEGMVDEFYRINHQPLYWFSSEEKMGKATEWLTMIATAGHLGINTDKNQADQIRVALLSNNRLDNPYKEQRDRQITGWILNFIRELQGGNIKFDYNEISAPLDSVYIYQLLKSDPGEPVSQIVSSLECKGNDYRILKKFLNDSVSVTDTLKYRKVAAAMNYCRYFETIHPLEYVIANIPAAEATYFRNDSLILKMRAVVGMKSNPSPTIASYMRNIVTFPLWNVPHSISVKEILPKVQKNVNYLDINDYELVDAKGNVVDESVLKWKNYNKNNFPYCFARLLDQAIL